MKYRHELKYLINDGDAALLRQRLKVVMSLDPHAARGEYHVRSLYFDDWDCSALEDKINGIGQRRKYRIRVYDLSDTFISLECKIKSDAYIAKQTAHLSVGELEKIMAGQWGFLLKREEELCRRFYFELTSNVLRPKVYVDYEREPFVSEAGDVRVTIDKNVRGAYPSLGMFEGGMAFYNALESGQAVLEVKFSEFLPDIIKDILPLRAVQSDAVSKYVMCAQKINYLYAKESIVL